MRLKSGKFEDMANDIISNKKKIIMFGAGVIGTITTPEILFSLKLDKCVECYLDNNAQKWGKTIISKIGEKSVYSPEYLQEADSNTAILINISRYADVIEQLENMECTQNMICYIIPMMCVINYKQMGNQGVIKESKQQLIPKVIHYMWLGGKSIPRNLQQCIDTWKKFCPDYEIIRWDESNYDLGKNLFMKQAYEVGAFGYVPDYARLDILYNYGGIYLDTDVELIRNLDDLLYQKAFCGVEKWQVVNFGGCSGSVKNSRAIKMFLDDRKEIRFINEGNRQNENTCGFYDTKTILKNGYIMNGRNQNIEGINVYTSDFFQPYDYMSGRIEITDDTFSIHHFNGGWLNEQMKLTNQKTMQQYESLYKRTLEG